MRIAYVTDSVYPFNKGGKEKRLFEISKRLADTGHEIDIYTMKWWKGRKQSIVKDGVTLHAISKLYPMYSGDRRSIKQSLLFALACFKLIGIKADIVDVDHMPFFPVFSMRIVTLLRGKRLYGTWHEALEAKEWVGYMGVTGYIAALIERLSIFLPNTITAASSHTSRQLSKIHGRNFNVSTVASGVDTDLIRHTQPINEQCDILYTGRFVKDKNVDKLIEAFSVVAKNTSDVNCVIIGHGIEKQNIVTLIRKLGLEKRVVLLDPRTESSEIYAYMKRAKVFVLPSTREGFGIVALEALACGTPVVTIDADANAAKDLIIDNVNGSIVPLDKYAIASAIEMWTSGSAKKSIKFATSKFDWANVAQAQVGVYR